MATPSDPSRRRMLRAAVGVPAPAPIRPPGALSEARFVELCTRCDACVRACPEQIIRRGDGGFPVLDFQSAGCTFCAACVDACEPAALRGSVPVKLPWQAQVSNACLAQSGVVCQSCRDACEVRAIVFAPGRDRLSPQLSLELCTGCGSCVSACPASAITLRAAAIEPILPDGTRS